MKKFILCACMVFAAVFAATSCNSVSTTKANKSLIVYYSWSQDGNTRTIAKAIQKLTGADIWEIKPVKAYPTDYAAVLADGKKDLDAGTGPEIEACPFDVSSYSTVYVGSPIWFGTYSTPTRSFLQKYQLKNVNVVPFCTHGSGGPSRYYDDVAKLCPNAKILTGFARAGANKEDPTAELTKWLTDNGCL